MDVEPLATRRLCLLAGRKTAAGGALGQGLESQTIPPARLAEFDLVGLDPRSGLRRQVE